MSVTSFLSRNDRLGKRLLKGAMPASNYVSERERTRRSPAITTALRRHCRALTSVSIVVLLMSLWSSSASNAQTFQPLGFLPNQDGSDASAISANGSTVVGHGAAPPQAFLWSSGAMNGLGTLTGDVGSDARGISSDSTVVVGASYGTTVQAVRWTAATGMVGLGFLPGGQVSVASAANADGTVVVGSSNTSSSVEAFSWNSSGGMMPLGFLTSYDMSSASGVSVDGATVIGESENSTSGSVQAFRWTAGTGMVGLGFLTGDDGSSASAVSADGSTIVGVSTNSSTGSVANFLWTSGGGMSSLGMLPGDTFSFPLAVNSNASVVVGESVGLSSRAFRWTALSGMQSVQDLLTSAGLNLTQWQLTAATGVSADGTIITGNGIDPNGLLQAWIATLPSTAAPALIVTPTSDIMEAGNRGGRSPRNLSMAILRQRICSIRSARHPAAWAIPLLVSRRGWTLHPPLARRRTHRPS